MADGTIKIDTTLDSSGFESGLSKLGSIAAAGTKTALAVISGASAALGGLGVAAVKVGSGFEAEMSKVEAISGATGSDLERLTETAKKMGATTKFSASESAMAMEYMAMAGWEADEMLVGIEGIMNLAAASGEDLALTSDIVTDALTAFGLTAKGTGHFADVLAAASSSANTNVSMLGESFKYVAPVAGAMGYSVEDTAVALSLMANSGIKASQGGTALRSTLSRMAKPTKEVQGAMDDLGIALTDSEGNMKSLGELMEELRYGFDGLTESEKAQYAAALAGQEGMSGLLAIVNASDEDFNKLTDAVYGCDGAAEQMAQTMQDNLAGSLTILKSSVEGLGIEVYEELEEPFKEAADAGVGYINELTDAFKIGGFSGLVSAAGDIFAELVTKAAEQAPRMIDTAVNLIESFVKGLIKNKGRLAKGAKEIVVALADGLVKLLPRQLQAPVQDTINSLVASFERGGLGKAVGIVATMFGNLCDAVGSLAKIALPPLTTGLDLLGEHFDLLVGTAAAAYAGIKTFNGIVSATDGVTNMISKVQGLWGLLAAHPFATVVAAGGAILAGVAALSMTVPDANAELKAFGEEMSNAAQATRDAKAAREEATESIKAEYEHYEALWNELQGIVDQNGKVQEGCEERAAFIINELSEATGVEIEMNNGVIQSYQDVRREVSETLEAKKTEARLNAYRADYEEAIRNEAKAQEDYTKAVADHSEELAKNNQLHEEYDALSEKVNSSMNLSESESRKYEEALSELSQQIYESDEALAITEQALKDAGYVWQENQQIIENWETAAGSVESGSAVMQAALFSMEQGLLRHGSVNQETLKKQRDDAWDHYQRYKELAQAEGSHVTETMVNEAAAMFSMTHAEWLKGTGATEQDIAYWNSAACSTINGSPLPEFAEQKAQKAVDEFCEEMTDGSTPASQAAGVMMDGARAGAEAAQSWKPVGEERTGQVADGISGKSGVVGGAASEVMRVAKSAAESVSFSSVGENAGSGVESGILSKIGGVAAAAKKMMQAAIDSANRTQDAHSPAKKLIKSGHWFGEGAEIGIEDKIPDVARAGAEMMSAAVDAADRQAAISSMRAAMDFGRSRITGAVALRAWTSEAGTEGNSGKIVHQTVNINQPVKSPVEVARELKKVERGLSFG